MPKISELPIGVALTGSERFPNDQVGATVSSSIADIAAFIATVGLGALAVNQTAVGNNTTNPVYYHNYIKINPYNASNLFNAAGFAVDLTVNGPNAASGNSYGVFAIYGNIDVRAQKSGTGSAWVGIGGVVNAFVSQVNPQGGGLFGVNGNVNINPGVTGFSQITGGEFDVGVGAGATITSKFGCVVLLNAADAVQGTNDAAYTIYTAPGSPTPGWKYGYQIDVTATGAKVLDTTHGVAFGVRGAQTMAIGLDLSLATCGIAEIYTKHFSVDPTGKTTIGGTSNGALLTVVPSGLTPQAAGSAVAAHFVGPVSNNSIALIDAYGGTSQINLRSALGTTTTPVAMVNGGVFAQVLAQAFDGSVYAAGARLIKVAATQNWTTSAHGCNISFDVCANNTTGPVTAMVINQSGGVSIGGTADPGAGFLAANALLSPYHYCNPQTVGGLAPASALPGTIAYVTDGAASLAWGVTVTGGGTSKYLVFSNSVNWTVIGK
jgi:hypothetical protein